MITTPWNIILKKDTTAHDNFGQLIVVAAGTVGDLLDVIQAQSYWVQFPNIPPTLIWPDDCELVRKPGR